MHTHPRPPTHPPTHTHAHTQTCDCWDPCGPISTDGVRGVWWAGWSAPLNTGGGKTPLCWGTYRNIGKREDYKYLCTHVHTLPHTYSEREKDVYVHVCTDVYTHSTKHTCVCWDPSGPICTDGRSEGDWKTGWPTGWRTTLPFGGAYIETTRRTVYNKHPSCWHTHMSKHTNLHTKLNIFIYHS